MLHRVELGLPSAAIVVVAAAVLGGGFTPIQRLVLGAGLVLVWLMAAVGWTGRLQSPEMLLVGVLLWGVISAMWVGAAPLASKETITAWLVALILWAVARRGSPSAFTVAARILVLGAAVVAGGVIFAAVSIGSIRVGGLFENPNLAAALLVPALPFGLMVLDRSPRLRLGWVILVSAAVVLTGSRAGLLAAIVTACLLLPRGRIRIVGVSASASVALAVLAWRFLSQPDLLAWHRISIWWSIIRIWATRPLTGVGPGCLIEAAGAERILHPEQVGRYQFVISLAESTPLAVLVQLGIFGVLLAGLAAGAWWVRARRAGVLDSTAFQACLAAVVTLSLFHDFLTTEPVLWWWAVILGCFEAMCLREPNPTAAGSMAPARMVAAVMVIWLTAWGLLSPALARLRSGANPVSTATVDQTLRIEPWYAEPASRRVRDLLAQSDPWTWDTAGEALHWAETATGAHPGLARRWADLAQVRIRVLTDLGGTDIDTRAARQALEKACELDPHLPWHWLERARFERILGSYQDASLYVRRALDEEPNTVRAWLMLSRLELERGRMDSSRAAMAEARKRETLISRPGLTDYEREILEAPESQMGTLKRALGESRGEGP